MGRRYAMFLAGAVLLTAGVSVPGVAQAQETVAERAAARAEVPWYERFTYSQSPAQAVSGDVAADRRGVQAWTPSRRWGVTVNLREAQAAVATPGARDETAVGAYYQFTPNVRVGGQVSIGTESVQGTPAAQRAQTESASGVRLESAFRF